MTVWHRRESPFACLCVTIRLLLSQKCDSMDFILEAYTCLNVTFSACVILCYNVIGIVELIFLMLLVVQLRSFQCNLLRLKLFLVKKQLIKHFMFHNRLDWTRLLSYSPTKIISSYKSINMNPANQFWKLHFVDNEICLYWNILCTECLRSFPRGEKSNQQNGVQFSICNSYCCYINIYPKRKQN